MHTLQGIAVSPGVAIGEALVVDREGFRIPRRFVAQDAVEHELERLGASIDTVAAEMERNRRAVAERLGEQYGAIFAAQRQMLLDPHLREELEQLVRQSHHSPEYAVSRVLRRYAKVFQELEGSSLAERAHDITDIERSLLHNLLGRRREELSQLTSPVLVLAHDLTPSETANLDTNHVLGFATEMGGAGGHTAIVAKGQEIPAVVGIGRFLTDVSGGELVIVDGDNGRVILEPDDETVRQYQQEREQHRTLVAQLAELRDLPAETTDGVRVTLGANIEFPHEIKACLARGSDGVGLYRTEFLYLNAATEPTEDDHFDAYSQVVRAMGPRPVVIRTLDLGADKMGQLPLAEQEQNPFLGLRSIRLSLRNLTSFRVQLRAILRATALGPVQLMFPLISTLGELRQARMVLADVMEDLQEEGVEFDRQLPVGMMVEVPSAVEMLDRFLDEVDFISIGTNDLAQYALAVDRSNMDVAYLYQHGDPAVTRLIHRAVRLADDAGVPVSVCGQMSGSPAYAMLLLGLGVRSLSVPPSAVPEIKMLCRSVTVTHCQAVAERALAMDNAREIDAYLHREVRRLVPELVLT